ncbi:hypothetical protein D1013_14155 [Euzebyella marina]|uniref:Serine acetyltransferase n=1 Tax=Euzebyella marina TaxID=1761453 RepID=A0A3G2L851_9FLAO|nr:DapH/DapD/GlmU-related protein [Euzebyella marina]AYN68442.1 hypothetical protein D1013_14155 [Euzebyella marina]
MSLLRDTVSKIKNDFREENISFKVFILNYFYSPRFRVLLNHRIGKFFSQSNILFSNHLAAYYKRRLIVKRGCDISYNAVIGKKVAMPHPIGIVIGDGVIVEDHVSIFQQVTFGSHGKQKLQNSYPVIRKGARIYSGAKIIGGITIGENAVIGANSVVNIDVPPNSVAVGIPCRIIEKNK